MNIQHQNKTISPFKTLGIILALIFILSGSVYILFYNMVHTIPSDRISTSPTNTYVQYSNEVTSIVVTSVYNYMVTADDKKTGYDKKNDSIVEYIPNSTYWRRSGQPFTNAVYNEFEMKYPPSVFNIECIGIHGYCEFSATITTNNNNFYETFSCEPEEGLPCEFTFSYDSSLSFPFNVTLD